MKQQIIKIEHIYDHNGDCHAITVTRGSFYLLHTTRTYRHNSMSDAQHNLAIITANREKFTSIFKDRQITTYPAWFSLMEKGECRAAGTLEHCKHFLKSGMTIERKIT